MSRNVNKGFVCTWKIRHFNFYNSEKDRCISTPVFTNKCLEGSKWILNLFHDGCQFGCYITHEGPRKSDTDISVRFVLTNPEGVILVASEKLRCTFAKSKFSDKYYMIQRTALTQKMCFWSENTVTLCCYMDCAMLPVSTCQVTTDFSERFSLLWPFNHSNELVKKQMRLADIPVEISFKHMDNSLDFNFLSNIKNEEELFAWFELSLVNSEGSILVSVPCMSEFSQNNMNDFCTLNFCIPKTEICDEIKIKYEVLNAFKAMVEYPKKYLGRKEIAENNISTVNNIVALRKRIAALQEKESQQFQVDVPRSFHEKRSEISEKASQQFQDGASQNFHEKGNHFSAFKAMVEYPKKYLVRKEIAENNNSTVNNIVALRKRIAALQEKESQKFQVDVFRSFHEKRSEISEKASQQFQDGASQQFQDGASQQFQYGASQNFHEKGNHFSVTGSQQFNVNESQQIQIKGCQKFQVKGSENFHGIVNQFSVNMSPQFSVNVSPQFEANSSQQFHARGFQNFHEKGYQFSEKVSQQFQGKTSQQFQVKESQQFQDGGSQSFREKGYHFSEKGAQQLDVKAFQQFQVNGSQNFHGIRNQISINASQQFEANSSQQFQTRGFQNLHEAGYHFSANISQHLEVKQQFLVRGSQNFHNEGYQYSEKTSQQLQKK